MPNASTVMPPVSLREQRIWRVSCGRSKVTVSAALAVGLFQVGRQQNAHGRQRRDDGRRDGGDGVVEVLPEIVLRHGQGGEIGELASERNHLGAEARGELFHGGSRLFCVGGHRRGSIVAGRHADSALNEAENRLSSPPGRLKL